MRKSRYYKIITIPPSHPMYVMSNRGKVAEHRLIMAEHIGRPLERDDIVHHRDGNRLNNDLSNLELLPRRIHMLIEERRRLANTIYYLTARVEELDEELGRLGFLERI